MRYFLITIIGVGFLFGGITKELKEKLATAKNNELMEVIIHVKGYPDLMALGKGKYKQKVELLRKVARETQKGIIEFLKSQPKSKVVEYRTFWVDNTIYLKATKDIIQKIAKRKEIRWMDVSKTYHIIGNIKPVRADAIMYMPAVAWGVRKIWADSVWLNLGISGQGVIVGIMDTGCDVSHPALQGKWAGWWFDGVSGQTSPYDDHGHGTHVTGTILGGDGPGPFAEDIGIAYGANFCSAKAFDANGSGQDPWIRACFQWFATIKADSGVDVKLVSNSWGSSANDTTYWDNCMTWRSLDIIPVFAAGNEGPNPSTLRNPGSFPIVIGVGATDSSDNIASFSSRGPAPNQPPWNDPTYWPRSDWNLIKPNISAPGVDVYSSMPGGSYGLMSGTSMATPHVSGVLALIFEKNPSLDFYSLYSIILDNADLPPQGTPYPNNDYGWGRINAYKAVEATPPPAAHNIGAITFVSPSSDIIEQYTYLYPVTRFRNWGQNKEYNIYVHCDIYENSNLIYTNSRTIDSLDVNEYVDISFDSLLVGAVGNKYDLVAYCVHNLDTIPDDDTTKTTTWAAHYYYGPTTAWKLPNTDTANFPPPGDPSWIPATPEEIDSISSIDQNYWVTSGATDTAFQDLQLYGFNIVEPETLITKFRTRWIGHFGGVHNRIQMRLWNTNINSYVMKTYQQQFTGDATLSVVLDDSAQAYIDPSGYFYINTAANTYIKSSCPLVFTWDGEKYNYVGDIILGGVIGLSFKNILGQNLYLPADPDEYVILPKNKIKENNGKIKISINEMQQEITYVDYVSLIAVDHPENIPVYPLEAYKLPPYKGLNLISSYKNVEFSISDGKGKNLAEYIKEIDKHYVPFKRSSIKGLAKEPYSIVIDIKENTNPDNTYLFIQGTGVFIESGEVWPESDRLRAEKAGLEIKFPKVEVWNGKRWVKLESCGLPAGYSKTVVYPLKKALEIGNRIKITYTTEVYIDKIWVAESKNLDLKTFTLKPSEADLHYYGVSRYIADDNRLPGEYNYEKRVNWEFVVAEGNYTSYGNVLDLLTKIDDKFVIMKTGDEISILFDAGDLPDIPEGFTRDYVLYVNGFYKPIRPGIAYAYTVEPLPKHKMGEKLVGEGLVYYPVNPAPTPLHALIFRIYSDFEYRIPFSFKDAIKLLSGYFDNYTLKPYSPDKEYLARNTRYAKHYYPAIYADLPPHKNYEKVPLIKEPPVEYASLPDNSLHSDYVEVIVVTSVPWVGISEKSISPSLRLFPNYPNPFKDKTTFAFSIPHKGKVTLKVFDITGREVSTILNKVLEPGLHRIQWNAKSKYGKTLKPGVYIYNLKFEKRELRGKLVVMR